MGRFKKNNPGCKCCGAPPCNCTSVTTTDCGISTPDVFYYDFTVAGLTNDNCTSCATWNGTFKGCWDGNDTWRTPPNSTTDCNHTADDPLYTLTRTGGYYKLEAKGLGYVWTLATASWTCAGQNVLTLHGDGSPQPVPAPCGNVPATITLLPCVECPHCDPDSSAPTRVQLDFANIVNRCSQTLAPNFKSCTDFNATFVLTHIGNTCVYQFVEDPFQHYIFCPGGLVGAPVITARVYNFGSGNYGWRVTMQIVTGYPVWDRTIIWDWSTSGEIDCSTSRSLTLTSENDFYFCDWSNSSVTLTPL